jgi:ketosteroid isomerase-like protein
LPFRSAQDGGILERDVARERRDRATDVGSILGDDPVSALSFYDPDVEWDGTNLPDGKIARGHEAIVDHMLRWAEMWDGWPVEAEQFIDAGADQVIVLFRETGRSDSGLHMDERHAELYRLRDGKIIYRRGFSDPDEALEAVGTSR